MKIACHNDEEKGEERRCDECAKLGYCGYDPNKGTLIWLPGEKRFTLEPLVKMGEAGRTAIDWIVERGPFFVIAALILLLVGLGAMIIASAASSGSFSYITLDGREWFCTVEHTETRMTSRFDLETEQMVTGTELVTICDQYNRKATQ